MKTERIGRLIKSDSGAVALEFLLVLPIYLLFMGIALMTFELSMGKLHLQESNRNLAWLAGDRHFTDVAASNDMLLNKVTEYYTVRNKFESWIGGTSDYWGFGTHNTDFWAVSIIDKETGKGVFRPDTEWGLLAAGNMELCMNRLSSVFLGMVAASSAMSETEVAPGKKLYEISVDLTRTKVPEDALSVSGDEFRPESYLMRRRNRDTGRSENILENVYSVITESWPAIEGGDSQTVQIPVNNTSGGGMGGSAMYKRALSAWAH